MNQAVQTGILNPKFIEARRVFMEFMANDPDTASVAALHMVRAISFMFNEKKDGFDLSSGEVDALTHLLWGTELLMEMSRVAFADPGA